jgi:hypothetical protein
VLDGTCEYAAEFLDAALRMARNLIARASIA